MIRTKKVWKILEKSFHIVIIVDFKKPGCNKGLHFTAVSFQKNAQVCFHKLFNSLFEQFPNFFDCLNGWKLLATNKTNII